MASELFITDRAATTVTSGGTDAPAGGTQETWTVASSAMFGAAVTGVSQFHVADPQAPSEIITVTNVSGTAWTVTRGAESTTPVTHSAGFIVYQVVAAGFLASPVFSGAVSTGGLTGATAASRYAGATASGAPVTGTFAVGDFTVDQSGKFWICTTAGSPGTFTQGGGVASVTAADTSVVVGGTATAPTVRTGTLDVIAADHPAAADWSNNSHKITSLASGSAAQDAAAYGQTPAGGNTVTTGQGGTGSTTRNFAGLLTPTAVKTTTYTASAGDYVPCDTTSGSFTVTLPNAPADLTVVGVKQVTQGGTNTVTVACAGSDVFNKTGGATSATLTLLAQGMLLQYKASGGIWYVCADDLPLSQLDARYALRASLIYLDDYGADPTGTAFSDTAMAAAQAAGGSGAYQIVMSAGTYKLAGSYTFGRKQGINGQGSAATTVSYTGTGTCFAAFDSSFSSSLSIGGRIGGFTINGASAGASAIGMSWGNLLTARCSDITISNFTGASATGLYLHNGVSAWSEEGEWTAIRLIGNTSNVVFDNGSFDYSLYQFVIVANSGQNGVTLQNNAALEGVRFELRGNFVGGAGNTAWVIGVDPAGGGTGTSRIDKAQMFVSVESDGSGGTGHITVSMGGGSGSQFNGTGVLHFLNGGSGAPPFVAGTFAGTYGFSGLIDETGLGNMVNGDSAAFWGATQWNVRGTLTTAYPGSVFTQFGDVQCFQLPNGSTSLTFSNVPAVRARRMELFVVQPSSGAAGTITWPGSVVWQAGSAPVLQTANSAVDRIRLTYLPGPAAWYGEYIGLDQSSADVQPNGTLALGSTGKPGDAGHAHPSQMVASAADRGYLVVNEWPNLLSGSLTPVAGTIYLCGVLVRQPVTPGHVSIFIQGTGASGVTSSENFTGLYNSAGTRLAQVATDSAYGSTFTEAKVAISPGLITPGLYWVAWLMNASTMPILAKCGGGVSSALSNIGLTAATALYATAGTLQTSLPSSITPASNTLVSTVPWVALST